MLTVFVSFYARQHMVCYGAY